MNRTRTSAIVLLLASAAAGYEQEAHSDLEEGRPVAEADAAKEADGLGPRRLLSALLAWASGRDPRARPEVVT